MAAAPKGVGYGQDIIRQVKTMKELFTAEKISPNLIADIESRDIALWLRSVPRMEIEREALVRLLRLPWKLIAVEKADEAFISAVTRSDSISDVYTRKRGFVQVLDSDPSRVDLPSRSLPLYLISGRASAVFSDYEDRLRRLTMLESIRRSGSRSILVISFGGDGPLPPDLKDLWSSGFRAQLIFVTGAASAGSELDSWLKASEGTAVATLVTADPFAVIKEIPDRYEQEFPEERIIIRLRDRVGEYRSVDVTDAIDPERPVLDSYSLIEQRDLHVLAHEELQQGEFQEFFIDPTSSWRPYAAGLPWIRNADAQHTLLEMLAEIGETGSDDDAIAFIASESGAGGTTLARSLGWQCAKLGYPVMIGRPVPFTPDALPVMNFMRRVQETVNTETGGSRQSAEESSAAHETPWVVLFDTLHRIADVVKFRNELARYGRRVVILAVTESQFSLELLNARKIKCIAALNHAISRDEARALGGHLNQFLRTYGKQREAWQWDRFYDEHSVQFVEGIASFWVTLSFWIQSQYDLTETIQERIYKRYKAESNDVTVKQALLRIAALSSERLPLPDVLLPTRKGQWPVSLLLEDRRSELSALGLVRISTDARKYWALAHDVLGRYLINALFYDATERAALGYSTAADPEHLRFLILRDISQEPVLGEAEYRPVGEAFATTIFKIDPDHGFSSFVAYWRSVLQAVDGMPQSLRNTSRLFRHHTAISRRRVTKIEYLSIPLQEQIKLINQAVEDLEYALNYILYTPRSESNLNLYNSLANAYFDLATAEAKVGASHDRLNELRSRASEATRKAYAESPTNSYVIETVVKNLLYEARFLSERPVEQCVEALGILFSAMATNEVAYRATQLGQLAEEALKLLLEKNAGEIPEREPANAVDVLVQAWRALVGDRKANEFSLLDLPRERWEAALIKLEHPKGHGNLIVVRFSYDLLCLTSPYAFRRQLELLEQLQHSDYRIPSQLRLEYAVLLFQNGRGLEGANLYKTLRQLWRDTDQFADVPERLRWLRNSEGSLQIIEAVGGSQAGLHSAAIVPGFGKAPIPFRPEEFGLRVVTPRDRLRCHVSFTRFGPFLRPVNVGSKQVSRT